MVPCTNFCPLITFVGEPYMNQDENYLCSSWHCPTSEEDKNITWGEYYDTTTNCTACKSKCSDDHSCRSVECNSVKNNYCIWVNTLNCGGNRTYSETVYTCRKNTKGN